MEIPNISKSAPQQIIINLVKIVYEKVFDTKATSEVDILIDNLSYLFTGTMIATALSFIYNIYAGRLLGPLEYGKFVLIQSIAMFLQVQMLLGFSTAMVKYNSEKNDVNIRKRIISTTYIIVFTFTIMSSIIYFLLASKLSKILHIPTDFFYLSIIFAMIFVFYHITHATLQGLHELKIYSKLKLAYSIILLSSFFLLAYQFSILSFKSMFISMCFSNLAIGIIILIKIFRYVNFKFDVYWAKTLSKYSMFMVFADLSFVIHGNIDKVFINKYLQIEDVGIYNAYSYASINLINILLGIFITAFFPAICKFKDKSSIFQKVTKLISLIVFFGIPLTFISQNLILRIYGDQYLLSYMMMFLFAIASVLTASYMVYIWTLNATGVEGAKLNLIGNGLIALSNITLNILLIPIIGLNGAIIATIVAYILGIYFVHSLSRFKKQDFC